MPRNNKTALQKRFGDLLQKEAEFFGLAGVSVSDGLWCWDIKNPEKGAINFQLSQLLGYSSNPSDGFSVNFLSLVHKEDIALIQAACQSHIAHSLNCPFNVDVRLHHSKGHFVWLNLKGKMVSEESHDCLGLLGSASCIAKYKEGETQLRANKEYYKNVIKGANIGVWEGNLITGNVKSNERWAEIMGYSLTELEPLTHNKFLSLVHPDDINLIDLSLEKHIKEDGIYEIEFRMHHKSGHWVWVLSRGEITRYDSKGHPEIVSGVHYDITNRKTNELLLEKYTDLFERSSEGAKIGYWEVNHKDNTVFWSKVARQIHGVSEDFSPTLERGLDFYLEGEHRERIGSIVAKANQEPLEFDEQLQIKTPNGNLKWVRVIGKSEFQTNEGVKMYGLIQDIDEIKKAQLEIKLREEQFRQTFNNSAMGMALINTENKLQKANDSFCQIFGYSEEELQQLNLESIAHKDDLKVNRKSIEELFQGKHKYLRLDHRFIHKNGSVIWANITMSAIHNDQGKVIHFVSQVQDITERKNNELLLAHNKDIVQRINEAVHIGIWEVDLATNNVYWSPTIKKMVQVPEDFVPTLEEVYPFFLEGEDRETIKGALRLAMEQGQGYDLELQVVTRTGRIFWSRTIGIPEMVNGKCVRLYGFFQDIDEKTRATRGLAVKEEELRQTFHHAHHGMAIVGLKGKLQRPNRSLSQIFGYTKEELGKISLMDLVYPDDLKKSRTFWSKVLDQKQDSYWVELRYIHQRGHVIWVKLSLSAIKNDKGNYIHLLAQVDDITERKKSELLLLNYKNLLEQSHIIGKIGSWEINPVDRTVIWSDNLIKMVEEDGYQPHSLEFSLDNYVVKRYRKMISDSIELAIGSEVKFDFEIEILSRKKNLKWMRMIGVPEFENGKCKRLTGLIQDIGESKRLQLELSFSEEIFRTTFEHAGIGMLVIDLNGDFMKANPRICEILGYQNYELLQKTIFDLAHPEDLEVLKSMLVEIKSGGKGVYKLEKRCVHKNGSYVWVNAAISAVKNDAGRFSHLVAQIQDISDKKQLTENLTEHNNRLTNFAHIVSHNLRSHTSNISMLLDLAHQEDPNIIKNEYYRNIKLVSDNMNETIHQLSEIVEINSKVSSTLSPQNLLKRVQKAIKTVGPIVKKSNARIYLEVDATINVLAVHAYLESIILNLITNAIKYKSEDRRPEIKITSGIKGEYAYLSFADNGLGIDLDRHGSKLFGMYKTFHSHPEARGIGLFISKNQIEAMGGKIEVDSEINKGTKFTTYFRIIL